MKYKICYSTKYDYEYEIDAESLDEAKRKFIKDEQEQDILADRFLVDIYMVLDNIKFESEETGNVETISFVRKSILGKLVERNK